MTAPPTAGKALPAPLSALLALAAATILVAAIALFAAPTAGAHDGHDHDGDNGDTPIENGDNGNGDENGNGEFEKLTLNDRPGEPVGMAVLPDGRVLHSTRDGIIRIHDPKTGLNRLAAEFDVYSHDEEGLQNIAVDPDFKKNSWVYVYYSPPLDTPVDDPDTADVNEGDAPFTGSPEDWEPFVGYTQLSRFKLKGDELDMDSEQRILEVEADRGICCHVGGHIEFDNFGNLYLSTGDDSNPFESDGYVPIDERPDSHPAFDAQRTSANSNDLRGKLLRIKVKKDGSYSIPKGNLFPKGTEGARPEIYAMGLRNPFRFGIDPKSGVVYMADYSPDAGEADPLRGPAGHGKWMVIREAGYHGWPYCVTPDMPYVDYDFATEESGEPFDCANPVNESPHNTGLTELPPTEQPDVWYPGDESELFPELGSGGVGPMGGPVYDFDKRSKSPFKWPKSFDGNAFFFEWTRDHVKEFELDRKGRFTGQINGVLDDFATENPISMEFGPKGEMYVLEYGDGYFAENPEAQLARFNYVRGGYSPQVTVEAVGETMSPEAPFEVEFTSEGTHDPDGDRQTAKLKYRWDFDGDGKVDSRDPNPTHTFDEPGLYDATLLVTDQTGRTGRDSVEIIVGNTPPEVSFVTPTEGDPFEFGDTVAFEIEIVDDQEVDCSNVRVTYILGHDDHGHPLTTTTGCSGTITTFIDSGHSGEANLYGVFNVSYTDTPEDEGVPPLSASAEVVLTPGTGGGETLDPPDDIEEPGPEE